MSHNKLVNENAVISQLSFSHHQEILFKFEGKTVMDMQLVSPESLLSMAIILCVKTRGGTQFKKKIIELI